MSDPSATTGTEVGHRIVSLLPSATEIVYVLGLDDALVGVTFECDYPADARTKPFDQAVLAGEIRDTEEDFADATDGWRRDKLANRLDQLKALQAALGHGL